MTKQKEVNSTKWNRIAQHLANTAEEMLKTKTVPTDEQLKDKQNQIVEFVLNPDYYHFLNTIQDRLEIHNIETHKKTNFILTPYIKF